MAWGERIMPIYAVIDDYGEDWEEGNIAFQSISRGEVEDWAENENFHSASIVRIEDGKRTRLK